LAHSSSQRLIRQQRPHRSRGAVNIVRSEQEAGVAISNYLASAAGIRANYGCTSSQRLQIDQRQTLTWTARQYESKGTAKERAQPLARLDGEQFNALAEAGFLDHCCDPAFVRSATRDE